MENSLGIFQKLWRWWSDSHPMIIPIEHSIEFCNGNSLPIFCTSAFVFFFMSKILPLLHLKWKWEQRIASHLPTSLQFTLQRFQNLIFCYVCKIWCLHHPTICWFITRRLQTTHRGSLSTFLFCLAELRRRCLCSSSGRVCLFWQRELWLLTIGYYFEKVVWIISFLSIFSQCARVSTATSVTLGCSFS